MLLLLAGGVLAAEKPKEGEPPVAVWDTCTRSSGGGVELAKRDAWQAVAPEAWAKHTFKGDALVENDKLQVLFGVGCPGPTVYSRSGVGVEPKRMVLIPLSAKREPCETIASVKLLEKAGEEATVEVLSQSKGGKRERITVSLGSAHNFVKVSPVENAPALRVRARTRFAVIPDFFGDDMVFDSRRSPGDRLFVPAENLLLSLAGDGRTILMAAWPAGDQEVDALIGGEKDARLFEGVELTFDKKSLCLAVLDGPGLWHSVALEQASCADKDLDSGWKRPFEARWRGDFRLADRTDSWDIASQRDSTNLQPYGKIAFPVWFDQGKGMIRMPGKDYLGTAVIYPLERARNTPLSVLTPVDVLRDALGTGPCEYILDKEGIGTRSPGGDRQLVCTGVCNTTGATQHFFELGLECREGKLVRDLMGDVMAFNITVRQRLEEYRAFARKLTDLCAEEKKRNPAVQSIADLADRFQKRIEEHFAKRLPAMKSPEQNVELVRRIEALTRENDPENLGKYLDFAAQLRGLAGTQDSLAGQFRAEVRRFRRELGATVPSDRDAARVVEKLWQLSRNALRKKHYTEGS